MSTFDGIVQEFPFITIDYFRKNPERPPPLACFLSHVHSDHLQGLESFRAPFIYCSAATRELLLRIEKYPHRMNFNSGILESRRLHYKHLSKLLRPIPLNTPTEIELTPRVSIRVTLLDANHCTGAVMFLIEGGGKAILYTGDVRAEPWWVKALVRHPVLIPYTMGNRRLDKIYLDTTFARRSRAFYSFPTKAEGLAELLRKIEPYPEDTTFYLRAWTFGYEEVWMALAAALRSKVHVDRYQMGLYKSVSATREGSGAIEVPSLCGFNLGNRIIPGCLSGDEWSRIHSCEPGVHCSAVPSKKMVYITPIVSRTKDGSDIPEVGAGGGHGDLYQNHELELPDATALERLEQLCRERIHDSHALSNAREALMEAFSSRNRALSLNNYGMKDANDLPLDELVNILSRGRLNEESIFPKNSRPSTDIRDKSGKPLPKFIHFPYSRHSSYAELCELVAAFKPKDVHPCTVDPLSWDEDVSIQSLFGHLCSDNKFVHDQYMRDMIATEDSQQPRKRAKQEHEYSTQSTQQSSIITTNDTDPQVSQTFIQTTIGEANVIPDASPRDNQIPPNSPAYSRRPPIISSSPPSSPEPINDRSNAANEPLSIPPSTPETAKEKRSAIRRTWHFLHDAQKSQPTHFHLGPLPSSWPADDEAASPASSNETVEHMSRVPAETAGLSTKTSQEKKKRPAPDVDVVAAETDRENEDVPAAGASADSLEQRPNSFSQQSHTLSVSSSAFASQSQEQSELQGERQRSGEPLPDEEYVTEPPAHSEPPVHGQPSLGKETLIRNRRAAYRAARADSYDAWAEMSLVSAGNNHTEEEIEL